MKKDEYLLKIGDVSDTLTILDIMKHTHDQIVNKDYYVYPDYDNIVRIIQNGGFIIEILYKNTIVGFMLVTCLLSKNKIDELISINTNIATYEVLNVAILKEHQGKGNFTKMINYAETILNQKEKKYMMITTVHPDNIPSLQSFMKNGFSIVEERKLYGNLRRFILTKIK